MCGIAGIYNQGAGTNPQHDELVAMTKYLHHRGPDGYGYYTNGSIGLGHARLSIIDLHGGAQPIHNENKTIWLVFNGEIFNYVELREQLKKAGHVFYTHSDTEVIVHLYEQYGEGFVNHLNGQFAIALWDNQQKLLILTRDRPGILPLFFTESMGRVVFASEIKAILTALHSAPSLEPAALDQIMTFWMPLGELSIFKDIFQVQPGEIITIKNASISRRFYWQWRFPEDAGEYRTDEKNLKEELLDLLSDSTKLRLRSDVPVGAYLSGGLDSSIITSLMHDSGANLKTFSIGFEERSFDESTYQNLMINHIQADHIRMKCKNQDIGGSFQQVIAHTETPILRTAPVPMMLLSGLVRNNGYKVVLTGEGADEVFGGYDIFKECKIRQFWAKQPDSKIRPVLLQRLYPYLKVSPARAQAFLESFYGEGILNPDLAYFSHLPRWNTTSHCKTFFSREFAQQLDTSALNALQSQLPSTMGRWHSCNKAQYLEAKLLMPNYLLSSQGDRMLTANSVEGRFPFLDHRIIEFANRLHPNLKMKVLNEKYLLKESMRHHLPPEIINRYKQPYRAPDIQGFFANGQLEYVYEMLGKDAIKRYGYFDANKVGHLLRKIEKGRAIGAKDNMAFVGILSTQIWHNIFIENYVRNFASKTSRPYIN